MLRFSNVRPVAVLFGPGVKARTTVTMIGYQDDRGDDQDGDEAPPLAAVAGFGEDALVLGGAGDAEDGAGLRVGVDCCAHYSTLDFRIWRYRRTETTTRVMVMRKAMATPGPVAKSWKTVR